MLFSEALETSVWNRLVAAKNVHLYSAVSKGDIESGERERVSFSFLSVTIRLPLTLLSALALLWSFLPFLIVFAFFVWYLATELFFPFYSLVSCVLQLLVNNAIPRHVNLIARFYAGDCIIRQLRL